MDLNILVSWLLEYKYLVLLPAAAIEGPIISLLAGFFIYMGYFQFFPAFGILILGDLIPDTVYYYLGRFGNHKNLVERYSSKLPILKNNMSLIERLWHDHPKKTMFLSKLAYGLSTPFLISAGLVNMPFRQYVSYTIPMTLFQYGILMMVGYYLGHSYAIAEKYIQDVGFLFAGLLILFVILYATFANYARKEINKEIKEEEKEMKAIN